MACPYSPSLTTSMPMPAWRATTASTSSCSRAEKSASASAPARCFRLASRRRWLRGSEPTCVVRIVIPQSFRRVHPNPRRRGGGGGGPVRALSQCDRPGCSRSAPRGGHCCAVGPGRLPLPGALPVQIKLGRLRASGPPLRPGAGAAVRWVLSGPCPGHWGRKLCIGVGNLPTPIGGCLPQWVVVPRRSPRRAWWLPTHIGGCLPRCDRARARKAPPNRAPGAPPNHGGGSAVSTTG